MPKIRRGDVQEDNAGDQEVMIPMTRNKKKPTWTKIGVRSYELCGESDFQAFIFGADRPACLWAWSLYWKNGHSAWVQTGFQAAKNRISESIREIKERTR